MEAHSWWIIPQVCWKRPYSEVIHLWHQGFVLCVSRFTIMGNTEGWHNSEITQASKNMCSGARQTKVTALGILLHITGYAKEKTLVLAPCKVWHFETNCNWHFHWQPDFKQHTYNYAILHERVMLDAYRPHHCPTQIALKLNLGSSVILQLYQQNKMYIETVFLLGAISSQIECIFCECDPRYHRNMWGLTNNGKKFIHVSRFLCVMKPSLILQQVVWSLETT